MTNHLEVYKCGVCGNIVMVMHASQGELVCCGQPMNLMKENSVDAATEKHVPVVEKSENGITVKVGSVPHPMEDKHYIEWIEVKEDNTLCIKFLKPGEKAEADFCCATENAKAREYCSLHGLWT